MEQAEQAPSTPPPKGRRRRWLIVAFVLVLVGVAWWNWPRVDSRFVGQWRFVADDGGVIDMTFRSNGVGRADGPFTHSGFFWRVTDNKLVVGPSLGQRMLPAATWLSQRVEKLTGIYFPYLQEVWPVTEVSPERLVLLPNEEARIEAAQVWTRIQE